MKKPITIAIADDDILIVNLLKTLLHQFDHLKVVCIAENGLELLENLSSLDEIPSILLLDMKMKKMNGIETLEKVRVIYPQIKTIIISSYYNNTFIGFMMKAEVAAFIPKGISPTKLVEIIETVDSNGYYLTDDQLDIIRQQIPTNTPKPILETKQSLSNREIEIIQMICQQNTAKEIATKLFITPRTVEGHKNNIFAKTGVKNSAGLVIYALQNQLIDFKELPLV
ncbi:MAG: response regulator [Fluviicola sp.]